MLNIFFYDVPWPQPCGFSLFIKQAFCIKLVSDGLRNDLNAFLSCPMLLSGKISIIAAGLVFLPAVIGAQCAATLNTAVVCPPALALALVPDDIQSVATRLQTHYYNSANGQYNGGSLWTDAVLTVIFLYTVLLRILTTG